MKPTASHASAYGLVVTALVGIAWLMDLASQPAQVSVHVLGRPLESQHLSSPDDVSTPGARSVESAIVLPQPNRSSGPASLISQFESTTDLRAFAQMALSRTADGGVFYALRALAECRLWADVADELDHAVTATRTHGELQRRQHAVDLSRRRCSAFQAVELSDAEIQRLTALGIAEHDPLVTVYQSWSQALELGTAEALAAALHDVLQRPDPALIEWVAMSGGQFLSLPVSPDTALDEISIHRRTAAWSQLACELGADCSRLDRRVASPCIGAGLCDAGPPMPFATRGYQDTAHPSLALTEDLASLKLAVASRNVGALLGGLLVTDAAEH